MISSLSSVQLNFGDLSRAITHYNEEKTPWFQSSFLSRVTQEAWYVIPVISGLANMSGCLAQRIIRLDANATQYFLSTIYCFPKSRSFPNFLHKAIISCCQPQLHLFMSSSLVKRERSNINISFLDEFLEAFFEEKLIFTTPYYLHLSFFKSAIYNNLWLFLSILLKQFPFFLPTATKTFKIMLPDFSPFPQQLYLYLLLAPSIQMFSTSSQTGFVFSSFQVSNFLFSRYSVSQGL